MRIQPYLDTSKWFPSIRANARRTVLDPFGPRTTVPPGRLEGAGPLLGFVRPPPYAVGTPSALVASSLEWPRVTQLYKQRPTCRSSLSASLALDLLGAAGDQKGHLGGSWFCSENYCQGYGVAACMMTAPDSGLNSLGFRCAADAPSAVGGPPGRRRSSMGPMPPQQPPGPPRLPAAAGLAFSLQSYARPQRQNPYKNRPATDLDCGLCVPPVHRTQHEGCRCKRQQSSFAGTFLQDQRRSQRRGLLVPRKWPAD